MIVRIDDGSDMPQDSPDTETGDIRVYYDGRGPDETHTLQLRLTDEGLILDLVDEDGDVVGTAGYTVDELEELCH